MEPRRPARRRRHRSAGVAAALALLAGACSGAGGEATTPTVAPDCADLRAQAAYTVELVDYAFVPSCAIVAADAPFDLPNTGEAVHTFTIEGTGVDVEVGPGDTFASADGLGLAPGVYPLRCTLHPQMLGTLDVR